MAHLHLVADNDLCFSIDGESRAITYLGENAPIISHMDHNSEYFVFEIPRYIEGHDMLLCNVVQVHYINISSNSSVSRKTGIYKVIDLQLDQDDETESTLLCSWLVSQDATSLVGSLSFALRFACVTGDKVDYDWHTGPFSGVTIAPTVDNSEVVVAQYTDILQSWYEELFTAGAMGYNAIIEAKQEALEAIAAAKQEPIDPGPSVEIINQAKQQALEKIKTAEADIMDKEREELIAEILDRIVLTGTNHYTRAEGVSV